MVGLLIIVVVDVRVDRRPSDAMADDAVFIRVPGICGVLPLVVWNCDFQ